MFWYFVVSLFILGWLGAKPIENPYVRLGQIMTFTYFAYFYLTGPFIIYIENAFHRVKEKLEISK